MCVWEICIDASQEVGAVEEKKSLLGVIRQTPTYSRPFIPSTHFLFSSTVPFWSCGRVLPWHPADLLIVWVTSDTSFLSASIDTIKFRAASFFHLSLSERMGPLVIYHLPAGKKKPFVFSQKKKSLAGPNNTPFAWQEFSTHTCRSSIRWYFNISFFLSNSSRNHSIRYCLYIVSAGSSCFRSTSNSRAHCILLQPGQEKRRTLWNWSWLGSATRRQLVMRLTSCDVVILAPFFLLYLCLGPKKQEEGGGIFY